MEVVLLASSYKTPFKNNKVSVNGNKNALYSDTTNDDYSWIGTSSGTTGDILINSFDISFLPENIEITRLYFNVKMKGTSFDYCKNFAASICSGDNVLKRVPLDMKSSPQIFTVEADPGTITPFDLKQIGVSLEYYLSSGWSASFYLYGVELHIEYEESNSGIAKTHPTSYKTPWKLTRFLVNDRDVESHSFEESLSDADSNTYTYLSSDGYGVSCDIKYDNFVELDIPDNCKIDSAYARIKIEEPYSNSYTPWLQIYSGDKLIAERSLTENLSTPYTYLIELPEFRKAYLNDLNFVFKTMSNSKYSYAVFVYGMDLTVSYSEGEEPAIIETIAVRNYSKKPEAVSKGTHVHVNDTPNTDGYIGNLYNDDLTDYAEFNYVAPTPEEIEELPEEELRTLGMIKIDSPTFTSFGIPDTAIITNIKLTKESMRTCKSESPICELYLRVNNDKYDSRGFQVMNSFTNNVYDTGDISIPKLNLNEDKVSFILEWKSQDTPFNLKVRYLLWEIIYEVGGMTYTIKFSSGEIKQITVGNITASSLYKGKEKLF